jgi:hypothetical protein
MRLPLRPFLLILPAFVAFGCGAEKLVSVSGTATCNGKAVPNLVINFVPEKGPKSYAVTDKTGHFEMICTDGRNGVVLGKHRVWVHLNTTGTKENPALRKELLALRAEPAIAQMLKKYGNVETTPLSFTIEDARELELKLD